MDIRVLRYFLAAAEQQSISGAAQKLHVTQPTLSRQFIELEEELGHTLFIRTNRKLHLTEKGKIFYERAQDIVNLFERTKAEIRAEDEMTGEIRNAVMIVHGEKAHSRYFGEDAFKLLKGDNKELVIVPGANHTDLYDQMDKIPFDKIEVFYKTYLK